MLNAIHNSEKESSNRMILSIIIPAKNESAYIGQCIDCIEKSIEFWGGAVEIILVDNGSTDITVDIAKSKGAKVIIEKKGTIAYLRNTGAKAALGSTIAFLDADCLVAPEWITYCMEKLDDPRVAGVGTRAMPDMDNITWVERTVASLMAGSERPDYVQWLGTSNIFIKKDLFWSVKGFDETLVTGEDVQLCKKLNKTHRFVLEKRTDTIHLRESKTLTDLFRREFWRGSSSLSVFNSSGFDLTELPSIIVPLFNLIFFISMLFFLLLNSWMSWLSIFGILFLPVLFMIRKRKRITFSIECVQQCIVSFIYLNSRSLALLYEICVLVFRKPIYGKNS